MVLGFNAMMVLFVLQMHLQKELGVDVRAERAGEARSIMARRKARYDEHLSIMMMSSALVHGV